MPLNATITMLLAWFLSASACMDNSAPGRYPLARPIGPPPGAATHVPGTGELFAGPKAADIKTLQSQQIGLQCDPDTQGIVDLGSFFIPDVIVMSRRYSVTDSLDGYFIAQGPLEPYKGVQLLIAADAQSNYQPGDVLDVAGAATEYYCLTQLEATVHDKTGTVATLPSPLLVDAAAIAATSDLAEPYESVLVRITDQQVKSQKTQFKEFTLASDVIVASSLFQHGVLPPINCRVLSVTGFLSYAWSQFRIEPRNAADIVLDPATCQ